MCILGLYLRLFDSVVVGVDISMWILKEKGRMVRVRIGDVRKKPLSEREAGRERDAYIWSWKQRKGHKLRNAGSPWKLEKAIFFFFSRACTGRELCRYLVFKNFWPQNQKMIHLRSFKSLSLWWFVIAVAGMEHTAWPCWTKTRQWMSPHAPELLAWLTFVINGQPRVPKFRRKLWIWKKGIKINRIYPKEIKIMQEMRKS